ncbi:hypothetical protein EHV15_34455 [Paenibacillus oralis]|uniref:Uncharacterized protein n=1 Tax=Paenibacillus oralis TaxID=2490856 RepID=A0A3P3TAG5_9BACL|nr:hypothetical protein EHV15_34455 [Paenibacillus oralis]
MQGKEKRVVSAGEYKDALGWVVDQFEKVLAGEKAGNVEESLSYAKSLLGKDVCQELMGEKK